MAAEEHPELIPTRVSLLERMKDWRDHASWQEFFDTYWKLIYTVARRGNLNDAEAQDVVQEVLVHVARQMPTFKYDPALGSFKGWLLTKTRWCILEQIRRRDRHRAPAVAAEEPRHEPDALREVPDPSIRPLEDIWDNEWRQALFDAAFSNLKRRFDALNLQLFHFYVVKEYSAEEVAQRFKVSIDQVYLAKHRVREALKVEIERLERETV